MTTPPPESEPHPAGHEPAHSAGEAEDFKPTCPGCAYDLSGLPNGQCPECGLAFSFRALYNAHLQALNPRRPTDNALHLGIVAAVGSIFAPPLPIKLPMAAIATALVLSWLREHQWQVARPRRLLEVLVPAGILAVSLAFTIGVAITLPLLAAAAVPTLHFGLGRSWRLTGALIASIVAVGLCIAGLPMAIGGAAGVARGEYWSSWDWPWAVPRPVRLELSYARIMSNREARTVGLVLLAPAAPAALAAAAAFRSHRRARAR